jgi:glycosyltransferase involved in cell wall biosynthesis
MSTISIIVPVFNGEPALLNRALESAFSQTYRDLEVIVVDDGSDSPVGGWIGRLCPEHTRRSSLSVITLDRNSGISVARNVGVAAASGASVVWLDADDTLEADCVEKLHIAAVGKDLVIGECNVWCDGAVQRRRPSPYFRKAMTRLGTLADPFLLNVTSLQPQLFQRTAFMALGGFDSKYRYAELTELFLRYLGNNGLARMCFIEDAVYNYYRDRPDSVSKARVELTQYREQCLTEYLVRCGHPEKRMRYRSRDPVTGMQQFALEYQGESDEK